MQVKNVEDFYPLSPLQQGMLFHSLYAPESGEYFEQLTCTLSGNLNIAEFERAWQQVIDRHPALRTAFVWEGPKEPVQVVQRQVRLPLHYEDWRAIPADEHSARLDAFLDADRRRGFELARAPLMRLTLIQRADDAYSFVWGHHHLLLDGWCLGLILREVFAFYDAFSAGQTIHLPRSRPYRDYIVWLQQQDLAAAEIFWRQQLTGLDAPTPLGIGLAHAEQPGTQQSYGEQQIRLSETTTAALRTLSQQHQLTINTLIQGAWALLLSRYSGMQDVVFGAIVSGRPASLSGVESIVGQFINSLPVRVKLPSGARLVPWLQSIQASQIELRQYEYSPLVQIQGWSEIPRGQPLFESLLIVENYPLDQALLDRSNGPYVADVSAQERQNYPLAIFAIPGRELGFRILYNADRFDAATIARVLGHLQTILEDMIARPEQRLADIRWLSAGEQRQIVDEWNAPVLRPAPGESIQQRFEAQAARTPDALAVSCPTILPGAFDPSATNTDPFAHERLSYAELNGKANQLARHLRALGVTSETLVGFYLERSAAVIVAILGILKAGGAYVPLNPNYPAERLQFMLDDTRVPVLITSQDLPTELLTAPMDDQPSGAAHQPQIVDLDRDWPQISRQDASNLPAQSAAQNLAYVIYTSGSTGRPKGVMVNHGSVLSLMDATQPVFSFGERDVWSVVHSFGFDFSVWEMWTPLLHGSHALIVPEWIAQTPEVFYALLCRERVTILNQTPSALRHLPITATADSERADALRLIMCGGEALPRDLAAQILNWNTPIWNFYGPTEATVWAAIQPVKEVEAALSFVPVGRPLANSQIFLLDAYGRPVPIGVAGELHIGGSGLARGYFNRATLTAEKFVPHPFSQTAHPQPGTRLYRTGDLARYLPDGRIEFVGRIDHQVKVRGFRIELGEIEATLATHPAVREAVVLLRDERLVAYVVGENLEPRTKNLEDSTDPGSRFLVLGSAELRQHLGARLPEYMVPSAFIFLDRLPLTTNGKLDRAALPAPSNDRPELLVDFVGPRTPIEELLAAIWADVLAVERVGIHDNFFALGGHSLLAIQLVARMGEALKVRIPLRQLFESPTVAELAEIVAEQKGQQANHAAAVAPLATIKPAPEQLQQPFALTEVQQAYWVGRSGVFELGNVAAHTYAEFESDSLDLQRLTQALRRLIDRHGMLRAIVLPEGQQQILAAVPAFEIPVLDLRTLPPTGVEQQLTSIRDHASHQILPADRWPLFEIRASLLKDRRVRLHVGADLLIVDAWSMRIIQRELSLLYQDLDAPLASLDLSFRDYIVAEQALRQTEIYGRSQEYWSGRLATLPPSPELPLANSPSALRDPRFTRRSSELTPETWQQLKRRATQAGLTPSGLLLAAFAEVLGVWSKSPRFTINLTLFNRLPLHPQINQIVGDFTSITLLEADLAAAEPFLTRAQRLQAQLWDDLDHRYVGGVQVLRELARVRGAAPHAAMPIVFTSALSLTTSEQPSTNAFESLGELVYGISQTPQVWLDHQVSERGGALTFRWDAIDELFPAGLLDDMFDAYCGLIRRLADEPGLWKAPTRTLVPAAHLIQRTAINATDAPISDELLHTLFAAQARRRPQQPAVITPTRRLSYDELARHAGAVGRRLRELGARPNMLVAVVLEKGWEQIVSVLGVLQSGAAYLPIDPQLPQERLWHLLRHAETRLVLTNTATDAALQWPEQVQRLAVDRIVPLTDELDWQPVQRPDDLAYVIYTSGSTGLPKGVMIDHRGAVNTILDLNERFAVGMDDRVLACSSLSFDLSVYDIFGTLAAGAAIVMPSAAEARNPAHWHALLIEEQVTIWNSVPALMQVLADDLSARAARLPDSLRLVMLSGDWIPVTLPDQIRRLGNNPQILSLGGATEASIWSILYPIEHVDPAWKSIPYGKPMRNQRFFVLDSALEQRPNLVPGQLYIGGAGLAQGYWRDPEKTRERFIVHPQTGERLYATGDLGRYLPDGNIEFLGREDFQVKIQGYRVELGEIEAALIQHPAVQHAVVAAVDGHASGAKRLVAYVVEKEPRTKNQEPNESQLGPPLGSRFWVLGSSDLRAFLQSKLPPYMIPVTFVLLERLPLTPNGKVDRSALPAPETIDAERGTMLMPPVTETEQTLARIWAEVLRLDQVGIHDNFFDLGGDSILGIQVTARANQAGLPLRAQQTFQLQTIAELAAQLDVAVPDALNVEQGTVTGRVPLTPIQHWFFEHNPIDPHHWNQALLFEVPPDLDLARLDQAIQQLQSHHDALRLRFVQGPAGWQQEYADPELIEPLTRVDLTVLAEDAQRTALENEAATLQASLDLAAGPLLRVAHFNQGADRPGRLLLIIHHLAVDAVSWSILLEDLQRAYEQQPLPAKTSSFGHWAEQLSAYAQSEAVARELDYWLATLGSHSVRLAVDEPPAIEQNLMATTATVTAALGLDETHSLLHEVPRAYQTQINDVLLTALAQTITHWSGGQSMLIDLEAHGRESLFAELNLSRTVGWLSSLFPLRLHLPDNNPGAALKSVKEQLRQIPQRGLGYGLLHYKHPDPQVRARLRALPQAELRFNYLGQMDAALAGTALLKPAPESSGPAQSPRGRRPYLLTVNGGVMQGRFQISWTYSTQLYHGATIERLAQSYIANLQALIQHCQSPEAGGFTPSDFPEAELSQEELDALLEDL